MSKPMKWKRHRFYTRSLDDPRPVNFPPPGPWWESGFTDTHAIVVCYLPAKISVKKFWPEAENIDSTNELTIVFTSRFPRPDWWKGEGHTILH